MSAPGPRPAFPWDEAMILALGHLGWTPRAFWAATPRELVAAASRLPRRPPAATRADLARLLAAHPDEEYPDDR